MRELSDARAELYRAEIVALFKRAVADRFDVVGNDNYFNVSFSQAAVSELYDRIGNSDVGQLMSTIEKLIGKGREALVERYIGDV